jgi:hypothetical protein
MFHHTTSTKMYDSTQNEFGPQPKHFWSRAPKQEVTRRGGVKKKRISTKNHPGVILLPSTSNHHMG